MTHASVVAASLLSAVAIVGAASLVGAASPAFRMTLHPVAPKGLIEKDV